MRALVVDDEPLVRSELIYALQRVAGGCLLKEAQSSAEAIELLKRADYDVVFLDIQMPGLTGLEAAEAIRRLPSQPHVVFVTAHENYAVAAFDVAASDYLLKPVTEQRLSATLHRLGLGTRDPASRSALRGRIAVKSGERTLLVPIDDVRFVQARGHLVTVALFDQACRLRNTLRDCAEGFEAHGFLRAHRAYLVNPRHVVEVIPFAAGTYALRMDDRSQTEVPVSRHFAPAIRATLESWVRGRDVAVH